MEEELERLQTMAAEQKRLAEEKRRQEQLEREAADEKAAQDLQTSLASNRGRRKGQKSGNNSIDARSNGEDVIPQKSSVNASGTKKSVMIQGQIGDDGEGNFQI